MCALNTYFFVETKHLDCECFHFLSIFKPSGWKHTSEMCKFSHYLPFENGSEFKLYNENGWMKYWAAVFVSHSSRQIGIGTKICEQIAYERKMHKQITVSLQFGAERGKSPSVRTKRCKKTSLYFRGEMSKSENGTIFLENSQSILKLWQSIWKCTCFSVVHSIIGEVHAFLFFCCSVFISHRWFWVVFVVSVSWQRVDVVLNIIWMRASSSSAIATSNI